MGFWGDSLCRVRCQKEEIPSVTEEFKTECDCGRRDRMPCRLRIKVKRARGLPIMDKASDSTDAYVEVKFADCPAQRTRICPKSLHPEWNQDFRFEISKDKRLQDAPVELKVWDHDVVHDDIIGCVYVDLKCLLGEGSAIRGWFPVYDTLRGIRGSLLVAVHLEFVDNVNVFRECSPSVKFFSISSLQKHKVTRILGFVEELIVEDDPEYHWTDPFKYSRSTNEQRQMLLYHISGKLRRKIGITVQEMGGNAVLGYRQHFDLEGEGGGGIVARGYGTACFFQPKSQLAVPEPASGLPSPEILPQSSLGTSVSELLLSSSHSSVGLLPTSGVAAADVQLFTLTQLPPDVAYSIGGVVLARAVKIMKNTHRRKNRDKWWSALRQEVKCHALALGCEFVMGYTETATIYNEVVVLTGCGTACLFRHPHQEEAQRSDAAEKHSKGKGKREKKSKRDKKKKKKKKCSALACHVPYTSENVPFSMKLGLCQVCRSAYVAEMILSTAELPRNLGTAQGTGCLLQARVCRTKKKSEGEASALAASEVVPFLEYDLHSQIIYKMRVVGANACFGLKFQLTIGDTLITAVATGTGALLDALPIPPPLRIASSLDSTRSIAYLRHYLAAHERREEEHEALERLARSDDDSEMEDEGKLVVEVQDVADEDSMAALLDAPLPEHMTFCSTETVPGCAPPTANLQMVTLLTRVHWTVSKDRINQEFASIFQSTYKKAVFKLFPSMPCSLSCVRVDVQLPEENEVQVLVTGMAISSRPQELPQAPPPPDEASNWEGEKDLVFELDPEEKPKRSRRSGADLEDSHIELTPLSFIPGSRVRRYLGRVNHHFVRETSARDDRSAYPHVFLREAMNVARAHAAAMGANALVGYCIEAFYLSYPHSKQGYCLISVSGDALQVRRQRVQQAPL